MRSNLRLLKALLFVTQCGHLLFMTGCGNPSGAHQALVQMQKMPLPGCALTTTSVVPYRLIDNNTLLFGGSRMTRISSGGVGLPVCGTWLAIDQSLNGIHVIGTIQISADQISVTADCEYVDGRKTSALASSAATINSTTISILETKKVAIPFLLEEEDGGAIC